MKDKIKKNSGFTLVETLITILILLMVSSIVAAGIPVARNAYNKVVLAANAEVLLSTTASALRNELATAKNISTPDSGTDEIKDTVITYYNELLNATSKIYCSENDSSSVTLQRYADTSLGNKAGNEKVRLVSPEAATSNLIVKYDSVSYSDHIVIFKNLRVEKDNRTIAYMPGADIKSDTDNFYSIRVRS